MPKITKIKASDSRSDSDDTSEASITRKKVAIEDKGATKAKSKAEKKAKKERKKSERNLKEVFFLFRPFVMLYRYLRDSWQEIRKVRWPGHKATLKMLFAVLVYTILFVTLIALLDAFFAWFFKLILK